MTVYELPVKGTYAVAYHIDLRDPLNPSCDCASGCLSDRMCRHIRAAQEAHRGDKPQFWKERG